MFRRPGKFALMAGAMLAFIWLSPASAQTDEPTISDIVRGVNTAWVLIASFLVFFMQAGFALVEAGFTRAKNTTNILMKNLMDFVIATFAFWAVGYAFMFGAGNGFIGTSNFFLSGMTDDVAGLPAMTFWFFQLVFAGTAATIVSGSMAERTRFNAYLWYSAIMSIVIYPIMGHWIWGGGWLSTIGVTLGLTEGGFMDFAGSTVVHSAGGWAALVGAWVIGPRIGRFNADGTANAIPGHSMALGTLGVFILWFGWFGFNPGSQLAITGANADAVALVAANTTIAAAAGGIATLLLFWRKSGKPDLGMTLNGVLGGLVAITAPCAWVTPLWSIVIGLIGGVLVVWGTAWLERAKIDDPVGAVPVHLVNGVWGTLAVGLFATDSGLLTTGQVGQLIVQIIGVVACAIWLSVTSYIMFVAIKATVGLRVSKEEEEAGLDYGEHGASAYPDFERTRVMGPAITGEASA